MRVLYKERRGALVSAIEGELPDEFRVLGGEAGMHLVVTLANGVSDLETSVRAAERGLWVMPLSSCYSGRISRRGLVLGFGCTHVPGIIDGVRRIREVVGR